MALGWGRLGHEWIAVYGSRLATTNSFFKLNENSMEVFTNTPDNVWKTGATANEERTLHWFQPDAYFSRAEEFVKIPQQYSKINQKFGEDFVEKNGRAPWRILQLYDLCVVALTQKNFTKALQMCGTMSHYVGDLSQPLHVTKNYDGQESNQKGLHAFFESSNLLNRLNGTIENEILRDAKRLMDDPNYRKNFEGPLTEIVFQQIYRSYAELENVLEIDQKFGRKGTGASKQWQLAKLRIVDGVASLALILDRAWIEAGLNSTDGQQINPPVPSFVNAEFYDDDSKSQKISQKISQMKIVSEFFLPTEATEECELDHSH